MSTRGGPGFSTPSTTVARSRNGNATNQPLSTSKSLSQPSRNSRSIGNSSGRLSLAPTSLATNVNNVPVTQADLNHALDNLFTRLSTHINVKLDEKLDEIRNSIDDISNDIQILDDRITALENNADNSDFDSQKIVNAVCSEIFEKNRRAMNVLVLGLAETNDLASDMLCVNNLLMNLPKQIEIKSVKRMGKANENRVRPLKLFLKSLDDVKLLFANKQIFEQEKLKVVNDSTPNERKYLVDLRTELNARINNGEKNLTIRYISGVPTIICQKNA